jgi:IS30 family transposase
MGRNYTLHHVLGQHLIFEDRKIIEQMYNDNLQLPKKDKLSKRALANLLGLAHSTFNDEISRGLSVNPSIRNKKEVYEYSAEKAQAYIRKGTANKGCGMKMTNKLAKEFKKAIADEKKSPAHARRDIIREGWLNVPCVKSIYNHIHHGDIGVACDQTPYRLKKKAKGKRRSRRKLVPRLERLSIEKRPKYIGKRKEFGHWEMDCIVSCIGGRGGLLVLTERSTRYTVIVKIKAISQKEVLKAIRYVLRRKLMRKVLTITTDNGGEFLDTIKIKATFAKISKMLKVYYAHAYCAWEKGSVENANRHIRRFCPKGTNFINVTRKQVEHVQKFINSIPRNKLEGEDANEVYLKAS